MERINWHRLFGLVLIDFFTDSPFRVDLEMDLSKKEQRLDVVVVRKRPGRFGGRLPDGLDNLAAHNLISFKSHQEALDDWALKELTGHYVNYRKQVSPSMQRLLPEEVFRMYAVCARYPHNLAGLVPWQELRTGVYQCRRGTDVIRVLVAGQLPRAEQNALLHLFSGAQEQVNYGVQHYRKRSADGSSVLRQLLTIYRQEGVLMSYTMEDFRRDYAKEHFKDLTPQEQREALEGLSAEQWRHLLAGLPTERRQQLLAGLSPEEIENYLKRRKKGPSRPKKNK
jgi:hypothetical protein